MIINILARPSLASYLYKIHCKRVETGVLPIDVSQGIESKSLLGRNSYSSLIVNGQLHTGCRGWQTQVQQKHQHLPIPIHAIKTPAFISLDLLSLFFPLFFFFFVILIPGQSRFSLWPDLQNYLQTGNVGHCRHCSVEHTNTVTQLGRSWFELIRGLAGHSKIILCQNEYTWID